MGFQLNDRGESVMSMYVKELGNINSPLMVFIHGGGVSGWMWDKQVDFFKEYHLLVLDLPAHGNNKKEPYISIRNCAEEIIKLIEIKANGQKVIIIGLSHGAQIIVEILSIKPEIIDYAIINSALTRPMKLTNILIKPSLKMSYGLIKNKKFSKIQAKSLYISEEYYDIYYNDTVGMPIEEVIKVLCANMSYSLPCSFKNSKAKTMILIGKKEKGIMKKSAIDMLMSNKYCEGYAVPNVGHGVSLADPQLFNQIVKAWINNEELPKEIESIPIGFKSQNI